jgi:hypothetical protein
MAEPGGWVFDAVVADDGEALLRLTITDGDGGIARVLLRPGHLATLARHTVAIEARLDEIVKLGNELVEHGIFTIEQRVQWMTKRITSLFTRVELNNAAINLDGARG